MSVPAYEAEFEQEFEINPIRKIYPDAMEAMAEHLAHVAAEAENEQEAAEGFLPLIPLLAGKLLPLAARTLPMARKALPRIANVVQRVTPQLTRGISQITRQLYRNPQTRPLLRAVPGIARGAVTSVVRQAAAGSPVTPRMAHTALVNHARQVLRNPGHAGRLIKRSRALDRHAHRIGGLPIQPTCAACGQTIKQPTPTSACQCGGGAGGEGEFNFDWCWPAPGCAKMTDPDTGITSCTNLGACKGRCELGGFGWCCCK